MPSARLASHRQRLPIEAEADAAPHRRPEYICEIGNEGWVRITPLPQPDGGTDDIIGEIFVYSDLFVTDKGIGAMSTAEDFAEAYPDLHISRSADCGSYIFETPQPRNVHFLIKAEFYTGQGCDSGPARKPAPTDNLGFQAQFMLLGYSHRTEAGV